MSKTKTEMFRAKGADILKDHVSGISDFLGDSLSRRENPQLHKPTIPQMHTEPNTHEPLGRLHLQVRRDLSEKLLDATFKRKRDPKFKGRASQRSVVEDALDLYFQNEDNGAGSVPGGG
jgi:hypothetical protein